MESTAAIDQPENIKGRIKASYDAIASTYNTWTEKHTPLRLSYLEKLFEAVPSLKQQKEKVSVLELDCGAGVPILEEILSRCPTASLIGNDMSTTQLKLARQNLASFGDRVSLIEGDMAALSFQDASQDAVIGLYSIIHLPKSEQVEILGKIARWLKPGGCLLATFSEATSGVVSEKWLDEKGWMFWSGFEQDETISHAEGAGLEIIHRAIEGDGEEQHLWIIARKPL